MKHTNKSDTFMLFNCFSILWAIGPIINAFTFPYMINTWLVILHREPVVVWWQGALIGIIPGIGHLSILGAVITWSLFF